jgi:hypothetical protein
MMSVYEIIHRQDVEIQKGDETLKEQKEKLIEENLNEENV